MPTFVKIDGYAGVLIATGLFVLAVALVQPELLLGPLTGLADALNTLPEAIP